MNFSKWEWRTIFVLDVLIKFSLAYGGAILASLGLVIVAGIEYVVVFAIAAMATATLNSVFLLLGNRFVVWLDWPIVAQVRVLKIALILIFANLMFAASWMLLFFRGGLVNSAIFSLIYIGTNIAPILIVAFFSWSAGLVARGLRACLGF